MRGVSFGQFYPVHSLIHRLDPRVKVLMTVAYIVSTFLCKSLLAFVCLSVFSVLLINVSRIPLRMVLRSIKGILFIIIFTSAVNIFMTKGEQLLTPEGWRIHIYAEGLWQALFMILRITNLIIGTSILLTYTTTPIALTDALESLLSPLKKLHLPVHDFAMMMTIALRFIPTLTEETEKIMCAQKARGADFSSGGLVKRAKALVPILVPLFVSAFNRAFDLASAMECRCYHGGEGRTRLKVLKYHAVDWLSFAVVVTVCIGLVFLNRLGIGYVMR